MKLQHHASLLALVCVLGGCGERHAGASAEPGAPPAAPVHATPPPDPATPPVAPAPGASTPPDAPTPAPDDPTNQAIARVLGEPAAYQATILAFRQAVAAGDAAAVAAQLRFPLRVGGEASKPRQIDDAAGFLRDYPRIVTPALAAAVAAERYDALLVNQQGVALAGGAVWVAGRCEDSACTRQDVKVVTIQPQALRQPAP
jgi:hypothetical protein